MDKSSMEKRLKSAYPDGDVEVTDLTGTSDHYEVRIVSSAFREMSRMDQHKSVMQVFGSELKSGEVHALTIKTIIK